MNAAADSQGVAARYEQRNNAKRNRLVLGGAVITAAAVAVGGFFVAQQLRAAAPAATELNVGLLLEPTNLNIRETSGVALEQILLDNVYQGLITLKSGRIDEFEPALAEQLPTVSDDGLTYRFKLRKGVTFHNRATLDLTDVVTSLNATLAPLPELNNPVITADESSGEVVIELQQPNQLLLWRLAGKHGVILDSSATNDLNSTANGTGPYTLTGWQQGNAISLAAYPDYWGDPANVAAVNFKFLPDGRAAVNAIKTGVVDVHTALLPSLRGELINEPGVRLERAASTDVFTLAFNSAKAPFNDQEVRRALSQAIDTSALIDAQAGDGRALGSPITEIEPGYSDLVAVNSHDLEAAKAVIAAKGLTGTKVRITAPNFYDQAPLDILASQLRAAGLDAEVDRVEFSVWLERVYTNHDYDLSYVNHAEARDLANYTNPDYYFGYNSAAVQRLYQEAVTAPTAVESGKLLTAVAEQIAVDAPAKWLYNYTPTLVLSEKIEQFPLSNTNSRINLESVVVTQ
ncbi:ABC transporter substrate-binding protein [Leucobacter sp. OH2974_COT-288]|nr:ABC transporter substrate-binding protein [Leucobacter sp. OH2974_COT-288]